MSTGNSPYYSAGLADGIADAAEVKAGRDAIGPDGARSWSGMYNDGYRDGFANPDSAGTDAGSGAADAGMEPIDVDMSPIYPSEA